MAVTNGYTTAVLFKARIHIEDAVDDTEVDQAINAASRKIDGHCGRRFYTDGEVSARRFYASEPDVLWVDDFSTVVGLVVKTDDDDDATFETTWSSSDYQVEPLNGAANGIEGIPYYRIRSVEGTAFPTSTARPGVEVTADWGWAAVPDPVADAALIVASELFKLREAPFGVAGFGDFGAVRVKDIPQAAALLEPYVSSLIQVG